MPLGPFPDWDACIAWARENPDITDPEGYCGALEQQGADMNVLIIPEGVESSDGRSFRPGILTWREQVPLYFTDENTEGHTGSKHVGNITGLRRATVEGETWVVGTLTYDSDEDAREAERLATEGKIAGVSADVAVTIAETDDVDDDGMPVFDVATAEIVGVTQLGMPAFAGARIVSDDLPEPIVASASDLPPRDAFFMPEPDDDDPRYVEQANGEIAIPITFEGRRFFGHAHHRGSCHTAYDYCLDPTDWDTEYADFHVNLTATDDGDVPTGPCLWRGDHAPVTLDTDGARDHYAHHAFQWGDARAYKGRHGIWLSGWVRPSVSDEEFEILKRYGVSGDWRRGSMIAVLTVTRSALGVRRHNVAASVEAMADRLKARIEQGEVVALVGSAAVADGPEKSRDDLIVDALRLIHQEIRSLKVDRTFEMEVTREPSDEVVEAAGKLSRILDT